MGQAIAGRALIVANAAEAVMREPQEIDDEEHQ
jgi:hypothetical protein